MCYVGKATKIFIFIVTVLLVTGLVLGFGILRHHHYKHGSNSMVFPNPTASSPPPNPITPPHPPLESPTTPVQDISSPPPPPPTVPVEAPPPTFSPPSPVVNHMFP
ncbi:pollen-specific leucine-rich repeat extensin-like protein 3 [Impatiens glandulifera]|uniref:pollen-specific leucine-rich repeat extensin-like protein 3 n=1 Tax=Impatiens glandulifera TaxID=253017 RepID=UPI001FB113DD|nr:pollen-specific leucine-rich repeat extensin-like protein 3 [Impatiens glandulifera]